jgi:hypothetical protein
MLVLNIKKLSCIQDTNYVAGQDSIIDSSSFNFNSIRGSPMEQNLDGCGVDSTQW